MSAVQTFEYRLAGLTILRSPVKSPARSLDTNQKDYSAVQKQFAECRHRFERASAKELQSLLPDDFYRLLRTELDALIYARNDLAHRYLRRSLEGVDRPDLREELQALRALGERFVRASEELLALMVRKTSPRGTQPG
jgi:hypothetical protein